MNNRLKPLVITGSVSYVGALIALNHLWYKDFEKEPFHFFNDNAEWKQVDKLGHFYSAFHISQAASHTLSWAGVADKKSVLWGVVVSSIVLTPIEIFDGFSSAYGASAGDLIANTSGAALYWGQQQLWQEVRVHPKFSFRRTAYPPLRPELLGSNIGEEILKDYNGQTYWLGVDLSKFIAGDFPKWLNIAVGYGATDMVYARDESNIAEGFQPRRQYYLALDFDFNEYRSRSAAINTLLYIVNMIHLPAPTLELTADKLKFHFIY